MSLDWNKLSPEERDARLTSLLLGELPPNEADELRAIIGTDPELARACVRRGRTISLLREAAAAQGQGEEPVEAEVEAPARLSNERREKLLETFKSAVPASVERARWRLQLPQWFLPMSAAAIFIGFLIIVAATMLFPATREARMTTLPAYGAGRDHFFAKSADRPEYLSQSSYRVVDESTKSGQVPLASHGRVTVDGQLVPNGMLAGVPNSDFGDKVDSKATDASRTLHRFAIALPAAENKARGWDSHWSEGAKNLSVTDFDSDGATPTLNGLGRDNVTWEFRNRGTTAGQSEIAYANGRQTTLSGGGGFGFHGKDDDYIAQGVVAGGVPTPMPEPGREKTTTPPPATATPAPAKVESEFVQATDELKTGIKKSEDAGTILPQTPAQSQTVLTYSTPTTELVMNYQVAETAPVALGLPPTAPTTFSGGMITNGFSAYPSETANFYASVSDPSSGRAVLQSSIPMPAFTLKPAGGGGGSSAGAAQAFAVNDKDRLSDAPPAGNPLAGVEWFGRAAQNTASPEGAVNGRFKSEATVGRSLNEGLAVKEDRFGSLAGEPVSLGFTPELKSMVTAGVGNEPRPEKTVSEGFVTYSDGLLAPARLAVSPQDRASSLSEISDLAGRDVNGPAPVSLWDEVAVRMQDRERSLQASSGIGGGAVGAAANRPASGEGFGNRSGSAIVSSGRNRMYAGNSTPPPSDSYVDLNRNSVVEFTEKDGELTNPVPQKTQAHYSRVGTNASGVALGDVDAFSFGESQSGAGGGGRSGRGGGGFGGGGGRRPEQNLGAIQAGVKVDQAARTETPVAGKPHTRGDVGGPVGGVDFAGLPALDTLRTTEPDRVEVAKMVKDGKLLYETGRLKEAEEVLQKAAQIDTNNVAVTYYLSLVTAPKELAAKGVTGKTEREWTKPIIASTNASDLERAADSSKRKIVSPPIPQPEVFSRENAFSTFSLNVSDVSYKLAAASLEKGAMPDTANIRSEEFINAFDYHDPMPLPGTPLAFAWERARYPFAHNRDVVRFSVKTAAQGRDAGKPLNIVVLLDNSGSMERADRVRIIQESLRTLAAQLKPQDKISVVTFARTASLRVDGVSGTNAVDVSDKVGVLTPEGGTNLEDALDLAYRTALRHYEAGAVNRIVLLTDGAANLGNVEPKSLKAKVENYRKQGIALDCFGIGWEGFNDDLLEQLSRNGDGRYGFVNTPEEAASEFVGQLAGALRVAASDVKMQVEFNPKRVTAWRQIGYAKHQLTKEQFRDNKVDAAEIGAAESGNALYVIETNPNGEGPVATVRARFRVPQTSDYREHEWVVPFGSAVELQQAAPSLRLAASASAFSEWLAASPYGGDVSTDRLLQILSGVPETYGADPRPKRLEWMIRQAKSISGK